MRRGGAQVPEEVSLVLGTGRETFCSWFWHKPLLPASAPTVLFVAFSKAASFKRTENCYGATLSLPGTTGPGCCLCPGGQILKVTPESGRYTRLARSANRTKLSSSRVTQLSQYPGGGKGREANGYSPTPERFRFAQATSPRDVAVNCLNKCKVQTTAKNLSPVPKRITKRRFSKKTSLCSLPVRKTTRCQEPVSRAGGERLEDSCPDKTLGGGLVLLLLLPRKDAKRPVSPQLFVGRGIAEVPWAGWVRQCLSAASSSRLQGGSFHHLLCQEVTHLSTGTFKLSSTQ